MNRSNYQCPPIPPNCSCCSCLKNNYSSKGGRGVRYAESSANEDDEDEDECGNRSFRTYGKAFARDEVYDNLIDLIDDQMISTMSALRKKARKFMKSELEQSFSSDTTSPSRTPCTCPEEIRSRGTTVMKKANEIDYQPQSMFLKKMMRQYQCKHSDYSDFDESDSQSVVEKHAKPKIKQEKARVVKSSPVVDQKDKPSGSCSCKCPMPNYPAVAKENSRKKQKKSEHVSRSKKKSKCRGNRTRNLDETCESGDLFELNLKQPHENSCERCWRFASPSRSPVNKPDQRYDPNFRRGHSCTSLDPKQTEELTDEKENRCSPCRDLQPSVVAPEVTKSVRPTSTPQMSTPNTPAHIQNALYDDSPAQFTPFSEPRGTPCRSQTRGQPMKPCSEVRELNFDFPSPRMPDFSRTSQQKCTPRPQSCDKFKQTGSLEKGPLYSSNVRNLLARAHNLIPATCNHNREEESPSSIPFRDVCGRGRPENLDPCMKRRAPPKVPCPDTEGSIPRGDNSRASGLGSGRGSKTSAQGSKTSAQGSKTSGRGSNISGRGSKTSGRGSRTSGLDMGKSDFNKSVHSELNASSSGARKEKAKSSPEKKSSPAKKPQKIKTKSPPKTPKKSPSRSKKGSSREDKSKVCSTNETQAYFKIPSKPKPAESCGVSHPIGNCRCFPGAKENSSDSAICYCHCSWKGPAKSEPRTYDQAVSPRSNERCCSQRPALSELSTSQGPRPNINFNCHQQISTLPNIDEYPEQMFNGSMTGVDCPETEFPCGYQAYMNNRAVNTTLRTYEARCERNKMSSRSGFGNVSHVCNANGNMYNGNGMYSRNENVSYGNENGNPCSRNGNTTYRTDHENLCSRNRNMTYSHGNRNSSLRTGNLSYRNENGNLSSRNENTNAPYLSGNGNCPTYGQKNVTFENCGMSQQMGAGYGMEYPRKYCVMYMTKGKDDTGDDVEVLVEELTQPCHCEKDNRMTDVNEKLTRVFKCPTESMALRFQKGVSESSKGPRKSRVLYF